LEYRWLRLAAQAQATGGALGHDSALTAPLALLSDKTAATCPVDYGKRAGELNRARRALVARDLAAKEVSAAA